MGVALCLLVPALFIAAALVSVPGEAQEKAWINDSEKNQYYHRKLNSGLHLTLHRVYRFESSSDIIARDERRVRYFKYRRLAFKSSTITSSRSTTGDRTSGSSSAAAAAAAGAPRGGASIGLKPGRSIGIGNYYVKLGLGTPVKYYDMIVDTGSSLTWLQCKPCQVYCHPQADPLFNPSTSTTYKYVPCSAPQCSNLEASTLNAPICSTLSNRCSYEATYGDNSYSVGYLSRDTLTLSTSAPTLPDFVYGCGQDTQGLFGRSAGLIGLDRDSLSMTAQLSHKYGFIFSYCLPSFSFNGSYKTGTLSIGISSLFKYNSSIENDGLANIALPYEFTPMVTDPRSPSLYFLHWTGMTVSGKPLRGVSLSQYRSTPTIIDSGTVISRIPFTIYEALRDAFDKAISSRYPKAPPISILHSCYYNEPKQNASASADDHQQKGVTKMWLGVPEVSILFQGGAQLKLGPQNVLIEVEKGVSCLAFAGNDETHGLAIIGNTQQQTFRILYDVTNLKIGFAAGGCD